MVFESLTSKLRNFEILVHVDDQFIRPMGRDIYEVDRLDSNTIIVNINQYELIYAIGTIQTRRFNPSKRQKFMDKLDLIEKIKREREFKVDITGIREVLDSERLGKISEDFGVGIAVLVADYLFQLDKSKLIKIQGNGLRPDIKCLTSQQHEITIESKGYTNDRNLNQQINHAIEQKNSVKTDIHAVSLTLIKENSISENWFKDPPPINDEDDYEYKAKLFKLEHYASVFRFLGQTELNKYFNFMRLKLSNPNDNYLINLKETLYLKIKKGYIKIKVDNYIYLGNIEEIEEGKYQFLGIDENLLSIDSFFNFAEREEDKTHTEAGNFFYIYRDGICVGEISNLEPYEELKSIKIRNYQEATTITDLDTMNLISFEKYIKYLFIKNGFKVDNSKEFEADLVVTKKNKKYFVEIKQFERTEAIKELHDYSKKKEFILITNRSVQYKKKPIQNNLIIIDRTLLKEIVKKHSKLSEVIFGHN